MIATTVQFTDLSITVHFVERSTTVAFPQCSISQEEFNALMDNWLLSLQPFASNEAAAATLDVGKAFRFSAGSDVAPRGVLQIVY